MEEIMGLSFIIPVWFEFKNEEETRPPSMAEEDKKNFV
jgi:hypothetical protein